MTQEVSCRKVPPKITLYPKSLMNNTAKLQYSPNSYEAFLKNINYFAFGDSFVNMFLHALNAFYIKLKGKSIKGLAKSDKEQRNRIQRWVKAIPKNVILIFNFGQVDLNFIRYYKLAHGQTYPQETFQQYVNWISSLKRKCIVLGIFASPIRKEHIIQTLAKYNILEGIEPNEEEILKQHAKTQETRKKWNDLIQKACQNKGIQFINIFDHEKDLDLKFVDQNPKTIHLRYLPCIIQVNRNIPDLVINIQKSLQIEQEYVTEKTTRYQRNLDILKQRKRLQSLQSQETRTQNNSSKDISDEQQDLSEGCAEYPNNLVQIPQRQDHAEGQKGTSKEQLENEQSIQRFIDALGIQEVDNTEKLDEKVRQAQGSETFLWKLADRIVQLGIFWVNIEQYNCCMMNFYINNSMILIKNIVDIQKEINHSQISFQKIVRSKLQYYFEKNLHSNDKTRVIEDVINLVVMLYSYQKIYELAILPEKLIFLILKEILLSVYRRIVSSDPKVNDGIMADFSCFEKLKFDFQDRMQEIFQKQNNKNQINVEQFYAKFLELLLKKNLQVQEMEEKISQLHKLLYQECPYGIFSLKASDQLLRVFDIELDFLEFRSNLKYNQSCLMRSEKMTLMQMKTKVTKLRQKLLNKLIEINKRSQDKIKQIENDLKCQCGCSIKELLTPKKEDKEKKVA